MKLFQQVYNMILKSKTHSNIITHFTHVHYVPKTNIKYRLNMIDNFLSKKYFEQEIHTFLAKSPLYKLN